MTDLAGDDDKSWYIDAWDPRGGRAFASWRPADPDDAPDLGHPAVYLCPPYFEPEHVASRATGIAATRGTFQAGLFLDEGEVAFDSLDEIIALVRRGYGSGGATPLPGGTSPPLAPRDGGDGGPLPPRPEREEGLSFERVLRLGTKKFLDLVDALDLDRGVVSLEPKWEILQLQLDEDATISQMSYAGTVLMKEMLDREPREWEQEEHSAWMLLYEELVELLSGLGVLDRSASQLQQIGQKYRPGVQIAINHLPATAKASIQSIWSGHRPSTSEILSLLARLPVPARLVGGNDNPSVMSLLCLATSTPSVGRNFEAASAILLLASSCVLRHGRRQFATVPDANLGRDAWNWISAQLPARAFRPAIEAVIASIAEPWMLDAVNSRHPDDRIEPFELAEPLEAVEMPDEDELSNIAKEDLGGIIEDMAEEIRVDREAERNTLPRLKF